MANIYISRDITIITYLTWLSCFRAFYCKNASGVTTFNEVVHCTIDEYRRSIPQHLHELNRKVPHLISFAGMTKTPDSYDTEKNRKFTNV